MYNVDSMTRDNLRKFAKEHGISTTGNKAELLERIKSYLNKMEKPGKGRPALGVTRKVSITLPDDVWSEVARQVEQFGSQSAYFRHLVENDVRESDVR